jgi:hypothetical protein
MSPEGWEVNYDYLDSHRFFLPGRLPSCSGLAEKRRSLIGGIGTNRRSPCNGKSGVKDSDKIADERLVTKDYLDMRLEDLEYRLTIHLGGMMAASIALVAALVKLT